MPNIISLRELLGFLSHASARGLMPAATSGALAVAVRSVFGVLSEEERESISAEEVDSIIKRFTNTRARDFNPSTLNEYGRRVRRAVDLYTRWRDNPADFSVRTRSTSPKKPQISQFDSMNTELVTEMESHAVRQPGGYQTGFPVRPGRIVTLHNVPDDLTAQEAERLAQFIRMLAVE